MSCPAAFIGSAKACTLANLTPRPRPTQHRDRHSQLDNHEAHDEGRAGRADARDRRGRAEGPRGRSCARAARRVPPQPALGVLPCAPAQPQGVRHRRRRRSQLHHPRRACRHALREVALDRCGQAGARHARGTRARALGGAHAYAKAEGHGRAPRVRPYRRRVGCEHGRRIRVDHARPIPDFPAEDRAGAHVGAGSDDRYLDRGGRADARKAAQGGGRTRGAAHRVGPLVARHRRGGGARGEGEEARRARCAAGEGGVSLSGVTRWMGAQRDCARDFVQ